MTHAADADATGDPTATHRTEAGPSPLWIPSAAYLANHPMTHFAAAASARSGLDLADPDALHRWSVEDRAGFWDLVWDFCGVIGDKGERRLVDAERMPGARFFPDATLNFAENLLGHPGEGDAIVFWGEDRVRRRLNWSELREQVSRTQQALLAAGVGPGDRVAAMLPNLPEAIIAMLATASIGAVWSSCSPDFGSRGVLDRFSQIEPKVLFACDGYHYAGKEIDISGKLGEIVAGLPTLRATVVVPYLGRADDVAVPLPGGVRLDAFLAPFAAAALRFERLPFAHPLYILFSSGTTGMPKCIVHGAGGTMLQQVKEVHLHCGIGAGDRLFYFTTCSWMMWNWLVSGLATGATLLLYDGSPFHDGGRILFDFAETERMSLFGTSAKFIDAVQKAGLRPIETHDLASLRMITSTGSPLSPESFAFVYDGIKRDVHLASISGGTDIVSCFVLGIPGKPVWKGEIQGPGLGLAMDVWDEQGRPLPSGKGELVCTQAFPSMPIGFWNDPDGRRYHAAYFERFDNVWCHGDFAERTAHGGFVIHGRSDATLNPGGVRIGTAEIYNQVETVPQVIEALAVAQDWKGDVRVILFVRLRDGVALDATLEKTIRDRIRSGATPRHVPARILAVSDIPRTKSGKIVELAVREIIHGRPVRNVEVLANPEALQQFRDRPELAV